MSGRLLLTALQPYNYAILLNFTCWNSTRPYSIRSSNFQINYVITVYGFHYEWTECMSSVEVMNS